MSSSFFITPTNDDFTKTTVQKGQVLSDFDTDCDSDSVASYETALEELDHDEDVIPFKTKNEWSQLILNYGVRPGALVNWADNYDFIYMDIASSSRTNPIIADQAKIEDFSGARLTLMRCNNPGGDLTLCFEGTTEQIKYAVQASNASIADSHQEFDQGLWVTLKLEGPQLLSKVADFRQIVFNDVPSQNGFIDDDLLHVSIGCVQLQNNSEKDYVIGAAANISRLLNEAYEETPTSMIGHLGKIGVCSPNYMSIEPKEDNDPINVIVYITRKLLEDGYGFRLDKLRKPHMSLYRTVYKRHGRTYFDDTKIEDLEPAFDLGPVRVTSVDVSRRVPALDGGDRFGYLASFPIYHSVAIWSVFSQS